MNKISLSAWPTAKAFDCLRLHGSAWGQLGSSSQPSRRFLVVVFFLIHCISLYKTSVFFVAVSLNFQEHLSVSHNSLSTLHGELSSLPNLRVSDAPRCFNLTALKMTHMKWSPVCCWVVVFFFLQFVMHYFPRSSLWFLSDCLSTCAGGGGQSQQSEELGRPG